MKRFIFFIRPFPAKQSLPEGGLVCQRIGSVPRRWQCHVGSLIQRVLSPRVISRQINKFGSFRNALRLWHPRCISPEREAVAMSRMQSLNGLSDSASQFFGKRFRSSIREIDSWMPSKIQATPLVDVYDAATTFGGSGA